MEKSSVRSPRKVQGRGRAGLWEDLRQTVVGIWHRSSLWHRWFLGAVLVLGTAMRAARLGDAVTYKGAAAWADHAGGSWRVVLSELPLNHHHILHDLLSHFSIALFGAHPWSLRLPAFLAGILFLPIAYAFVRTTFNRHIALIAVCLLAVSGPFVEYGAMARGYAITWPLIIGSLIAGRHFTKHGDAASLVVMACCGALALWAVPSAVHAVVMAYFWTFFLIAKRYRRSVRRRSLWLLGSFALFALFTLLCYAPVLVKHSLVTLMDGPSTLDPDRKLFSATGLASVHDLWTFITGTVPPWFLACLGAAACYAAFVSSRYRLLLLALFLGSVPLVVLEQAVAPPPDRTYVLIVLYIGSAIGFFHLVRFLAGMRRPAHELDRPTLPFSLVILVLSAWYTLTGAPAREERFPEAPVVADWFVSNSEPGDRLRAEAPWDAPMRFALACAQADPSAMSEDGAVTAHRYFVVGTAARQTVVGLWRSGDTRQADHVQFRRVLDLGNVKVFKLLP